MTWTLIFHPDFEAELVAAAPTVQTAIAADLGVLQVKGPTLGRPLVDSLKGSNFANMKELRVSGAGGVWRVAFAFDQARAAVILVAADKRGKDQRRFYKALIRTADRRFQDHIDRLKR